MGIALLEREVFFVTKDNKFQNTTKSNNQNGGMSYVSRNC